MERLLRSFSVLFASLFVVIACGFVLRPAPALADSASDCAASGGQWAANDRSGAMTCQSCPSGLVSNGYTCNIPARTQSQGCGKPASFFGLPPWYKYLEMQESTDDGTGLKSCQPALNGINDIWKIVAAVLELLLRIATLIAIGFIVYAGILYTTSQSSPDKTKQALKTIINALAGLVISIAAAALVSFVAGKF